MVFRIQQRAVARRRIRKILRGKKRHPILLKSRNREKPTLTEYLKGSEEELQSEFECRNNFVFCHLDEKGKRSCYL